MLIIMVVVDYDFGMFYEIEHFLPVSDLIFKIIDLKGHRWRKG